jgi:Xaa-Pro aminopeptidase
MKLGFTSLRLAKTGTCNLHPKILQVALLFELDFRRGVFENLPMFKNIIDSRLTALRDLLAARNADSLLVSGLANRRYLSGFTADDPDWGMLLIAPDRALLFTDFRYQVWAEQEVTALEVVVYKESLAKILPDYLKKLGVRRLGFEEAHLTCRQYQRLKQSVQAGLEVEWLPLEGAVEELREVKAPEEVAAIRRALSLTEKVFLQAAGALAPGMTEAHVAWEIEKRLREGGSEGVAFEPIVAAGPNSARPHHRPGDYVLKPGELVIIDMGARVDGYCADLTRTLVLGQPDEQFRKIYRLVRQAQEKAERELKAGMDSQAGDALARDIIAAAGYGEAFGHSLGHGVGLAVHEPPSLSPSLERKSILKPHSVMTVEPGIYLTGWGGVRLEDMVRLTEEGAEVLNGLREFYEW